MTEQLHGNDSALAQGSWVFTEQGVAAKEGFRNVSKLWYPKTKSFDEGLEQLENDRAERMDWNLNPKDLMFTVENDTVMLNVPAAGRLYSMSDWAARQLCSWLGVPTTLWTQYGKGDSIDKGVITFAMNNGRRHWLAENPEKELLFRTYNDGSLRAVLSTGYSIVDNRWYLETLREILPEGRLSHFNLSDADSIFGAVLIPDTLRQEDDSEYGGLIDISNSEIGRRPVAQTPSLFRAICMNGCRWGEVEGTELRKRHRGLELDTLKKWIVDNINKQIPLLTEHVDTLLGTHQLKATAAIQAIFAEIAKANNLSGAVIDSVAREWLNHSNEKTAFGVIDAVTRGGQNFDGDTWSQCNGIGGQILIGGQKAWDNLNTRAKMLDEKAIAKVFAV